MAVRLTDDERAGLEAREMMLRLADIAALLESHRCVEDFPVMFLPPLVSAFDYALRGDPGCVEPDEWQADRERALERYATYLGLGGES